MYQVKLFEEGRLGIKINSLVDEEGNIWFIGKEVVSILGYKDTPKAIKQHVKKENHRRKISNKELKFRLGETPTLKLNNNGTVIIDEFGLYSLVMSSNMERAEQFQEWVCGEVLPSLRKNNYYIDKENINQEQVENLQIMVWEEVYKYKSIRFIDEDKERVRKT